MTGITVTLTVRAQSGTDAFGNEIYTETTVNVDNVLVSPATPEDVINANELYGKRIAYTLGIPKGDAHVWEDTKVTFFGKTFHTFGFVAEGIEANVPTAWHKKVMVEVYG